MSIGVCETSTIFWSLQPQRKIKQTIPIYNFVFYSSSADDIQERDNLIYYPTHARLSSWLIGFISGFIIFKSEEQNFVFNKVSKNSRMNPRGEKSVKKFLVLQSLLLQNAIVADRHCQGYKVFWKFKPSRNTH